MKHPLSTRLEQEEIEFLSRQFPELENMSERVRALIRHARRHQEEAHIDANVLGWAQNQLAPLKRELDQLALDGNESAILGYLATWLPPIVALLSRPETITENDPPLVEIEDRAVSQITHLIDHLVRLGLTPHSPTLEPDVVRKKLKSLKELVALLPTLDEKDGEQHV